MPGRSWISTVHVLHWGLEDGDPYFCFAYQLNYTFCKETDNVISLVSCFTDPSVSCWIQPCSPKSLNSSKQSCGDWVPGINSTKATCPLPWAVGDEELSVRLCILPLPLGTAQGTLEAATALIDLLGQTHKVWRQRLKRTWKWERNGEGLDPSYNITCQHLLIWYQAAKGCSSTCKLLGTFIVIL